MDKKSSSSSSSSSLSAFHTLISVAMLPYNQSFIVSFVCCRCFFFSASKVWRKEKKFNKKEVISQLEKEVEDVRGSKIASNHVNQLRSCSKSATGTGHEPYFREWTAIYVLSPLVPNQVGDTDLLRLTFWWLLSSRDATS